MTYISKNFAEPIVLPNGKVAENVADVDAFLKAEGLAMASDYSPEFYKQKKFEQSQKLKQDLFKTFLYNYKRRIWK